MKWWLLGALAGLVFCIFSGHTPLSADGSNATVTHRPEVFTSDAAELQVINESSADLLVIVYQQIGPGQYEINASGILQPSDCEAPDTCRAGGNELFIGVESGTYEIALASMWGDVYRETIAVTIAHGEMVSVQHEDR